MIGSGLARTSARVAVTMTMVAAPMVVAGAAAADASRVADRPARCTIVGTRHADTLVGTRGGDVICGRGGDDVIRGRGGDDVLRGGRGRDHLSGGGGKDLTSGGAGGDVERGEAGPDRLFGGRGNDDLDGGPAADRLDGGDGTNWCIVDATDVSQQCVYDTQPPAADQVEWSTDTVDVTSGDRDVTLRVHVTDDTGATRVMVFAEGGGYDVGVGTLTSGTVRDGWWTVALTLPRHAPAGSYRPDVYLDDRVGHGSEKVFDSPSLTIVDADPDTEMPGVTLVMPAPTATYDVTQSSAVVTVKARIVDAVSGVDADQTWFTLREPRPAGSPPADHTTSPDLVSGDLHDGVWKGSFTIPRGALGGDWTIGVHTSDLAHTGSSWGVSYWGPEWWSWGQPLPDGMGSIGVIGSDHTDLVPPAVVAATVSPATVDTLPGPAQVSVSAHVTDAETGTQTVVAWLRSASTSDGYLATGNLSLGTGDASDGVWTGTLTLPQGTPPGTYYLSVFAEDVGHNQDVCLSPDYPNALTWGCSLPASATVTVADTSP